MPQTCAQVPASAGTIRPLHFAPIAHPAAPMLLATAAAALVSDGIGKGLVMAGSKAMAAPARRYKMAEVEA